MSLDHMPSTEERDVEAANKIEAFQFGNEIMKSLQTMGALEFFRKEFPDLKHAFTGEQKCVCCMDEGTAHKDINGEDKFALAGSGILFPADNENDRLEKVARLLIERGVSDVTSHGGCGAAGLAFHRDFPEATHTMSADQIKINIEDYAKQWADKLADKIRELGHPAERTHVTAEDMERPVAFHNARMVYFDGIGGFNPNKEVGLPMGFVIERAHLEPSYTAEELKVAISIAFGHHGFGDLFSKENPFVVMVFSRTADEADKMKSEVKNAIEEKNKTLLGDGRVRIDAIVIE